VQPETSRKLPITRADKHVRILNIIGGSVIID
jgi:hypothetical protein